MIKFFCVLALLHLVYCQTTVNYLDFEDDEKSAFTTGATISVSITHTPQDVDSTTVLLSPLSTSFDMYLIVKEDDDFDDEFTAGELTTIQTNIENYANNGGVVLMVGYDIIAETQDDFLVGVLGGTDVDDCTSFDGDDLDPFPSTTACEPLLNVRTDLRGLDPNDIDNAQADDMDDEDCLDVSGGPAFTCLTGGGYSNNFGLFTVRTMSSGGIIAFMSVDDDDDYNEFNSGFYQQVYNNILHYARFGFAVGDPHIIDFEGNHFDLPGNRVTYRLYEDSHKIINVHVYKQFIHQIGIQLLDENSEEVDYFLADFSKDLTPEFYLNDELLTIPGTYLNGEIHLTNEVDEYKTDSSWSENAENISTAAVFNSFGTITGGNFLPRAAFGFYNIRFHRQSNVGERKQHSVLQDHHLVANNVENFKKMRVSSIWA